MFRHLHRLESITIHNPTHEVFAKYFTSRAPLLKRMALCERAEREPHDLAFPFSGSLPFLEELQIREWRDIEWKEVQFGQLRVVDIGFCGSLDISLILHLIQENQHLEILRLDSILFTSSTSFTQSNTPVVLSHLKALTLSKLAFANPSKVHSHHPTLHILRHIRFPSCTKFAIHTSIESEPTVDHTDLRSVLPSPLDILAHPSLNNPQTSQTRRGYLTAAFSDHGLSITVDEEPGCEFEYEVRLNNTPRSITRRWLKSALEDRPGVTLQRFKLHVFIEEYSHMDDIVAFQGSKAVTRLSVGISAEHLREEVERRLLQILATPCSSASGTTVMVFPGLLEVEFEGWDGRGGAVLEMIRNRFGTPGVEALRPDVITINYTYWSQDVQWDSLDDIRELIGFKAIHFGAIDRWPSWPARSGSPESWWPPSDEGQDDNWGVVSEDGWNWD
ncbi:hypothetical protein FRC04_003419 [Tulasnella sp. 424]|nr:hypothetical protein FRC04_003419 [Tulasnella sp. 424]KAG8977228.1 hypothetical protein FRC05_002228 [Tulasnella sp. 425]